MAISPTIFQYFRECLLSDQSGQSYLNIYHKRVNHRLFLRGKEVLHSGEMPYYPLQDGYGAEVEKELALYQREKEFIYGSWFLVGSTEEEQLCAPLIITPASIKKTEDGFIAIPDFSQAALNLQALLIQAEISAEEQAALQQQWPSQLSEAACIQATRMLEHYFPQLDTSPLYLLPTLSSENEVKAAIKARKKETGTWQVLPAVAFALVEKPKGNQAIAADLHALSKENTRYSTALQALFRTDSPITEQPKGNLNLPELLSGAQQQAILNAGTYALSQITGPPGTGKTFTIANMAINQLIRGESVLIVTKTSTAADVIHQMIENLLPDITACIRVEKSFKRKLSQHFSFLLAGLAGFERQLQKLDYHTSRERYLFSSRHVDKYEQALVKQLNFHRAWGNVLKEKKDHLPSFFKNLYYRAIAPAKPVWQLAIQLEKHSADKRSWSRRLIQTLFLQRLSKALVNKRQAFQSFASSIKARTSGQQQAQWEKTDFKVALQALPIWVVTLQELGSTLPLADGLFDLLIVEEATQCDIASSLPAFQRAKRAVVVGDPKQLRHLSFLSYREQERLQEKFTLNAYSSEALNYRDNSILDLSLAALASQNQLVLLDEHYRSQPDIIRFSNREFYNNNLQIMTQLPHNQQSGLQGLQVAGSLKKKVNAVEAEALLDWLVNYIATEGKNTQTLAHSIGILSPFREQVNYLSKRIQEVIAIDAIKKHQIKIDTPYGFQGDERDTMLISLSLDQDSHPTAWRHAARQEVWNVSITRARNLQLVFHSATDNQIPQPLIRSFIDDLYSRRAGQEENASYSDPFLEEVKSYLDSKNIAYWVAYPVAGLEIDLLAKTKNGYVGIDLIGYPGRMEGAFTIQRFEQLSRLGIQIFPLSYSLWTYQPALCKIQLAKFIA